MKTFKSRTNTINTNKGSTINHNKKNWHRQFTEQ